MYCGSCVVLPLPVAPRMITTELCSMREISWKQDDIHKLQTHNNLHEELMKQQKAHNHMNSQNIFLNYIIVKQMCAQLMPNDTVSWRPLCTMYVTEKVLKAPVS